MREKVFISAIVSMIITACASVPEPKITLEPGHTETFGNMEFVSIPGGEFIMGSPVTEPGRKFIKKIQYGSYQPIIIDPEKQHTVRLSSFWMGKYEVTREQYFDIMRKRHDYYSKVTGNNLPVDGVSWYEAVEFCNKMSVKYGLKPYYLINKESEDRRNNATGDRIKWTVRIMGGNGFRLPTEAEWEFACRAGTTTIYHYGDTIDTSMANIKPSSSQTGVLKPVGSFKPNAYGLYDMHGNVMELCWDWYDHHFPINAVNPVGADQGEHRVARGGDYITSHTALRSAARSHLQPNYGYLGFRVVRSADEAGQ